MKIKCPYCKSDIEVDDLEKGRMWLWEHLNYHDNLKGIICDLVIRIYKQIDSHNRFDSIYDDGVVQVLKYVLDDKKKK